MSDEQQTTIVKMAWRTPAWELTPELRWLNDQESGCATLQQKWICVMSPNKEDIGAIEWRDVPEAFPDEQI